MSIFWIALSLGFLGSFHCLGMCGPIALALPINQFSNAKKLFSILFYNLGRVYTYSVFGIVSGVIGYSIVFAGFQQALSIILGIGLILSVILPQFKFNIKLPAFYYKLSQQLFMRLRGGQISWFFLSGMLNGLLPCGLVYMALSASLATGNILTSVVFMAAFGFGTFPFMILLPFANGFVSVSFRNSIRKVIPVFIGMVGSVLILRGLNLNIPYLSPEIRTSREINCHNERLHSDENTITCKKVK